MSPEKSDTLLSLLNISVKAGGAPILENFSLDVSKGERLALLGKNGSGKTTLLNIISGLKKPFSGRVSLEAQIGFVFQNPDSALLGSTVEENLAFPLQSLSLSRSEILERIQLFISRFDFAGIRDRDILTLSGGQRQLISLAAALISEPGLLLLDEPLSMIDRRDREVMLAALSEIVNPETSVIFATNRYSEVQDFERFVLIGRGRKLFDGTSKELSKSPSIFLEAEMTIPFEIAVSC
ncbi:MAG: ABC transporter ATP-binding protein [Kosmotogaceae bacterium]|nr:ABC transporter ATP-binding protein [Kosmotogaceae bacterium]